MRKLMQLESYVQKKILVNTYCTNATGVARTIIALAGISTLLFNDVPTLFNYGLTDSYERICAPGTFINYYCLFSTSQLWLAKLIAILLLGIIATGIYPRYTCLVHWWLTYSFATSSYVVDGGDQVAAILTLLLIPICLADKRRWHWNSSAINYPLYSRIFIFFCFLLIQLQIAVVYFHAGVAKLSVTEWTDGTAVYYWFTDPQFGLSQWLRPIFKPLLHNAATITLITWGSIALEVLLFAALFMKEKYRLWLMRAGILFHFFIFLVHGLFSFFLVMTAALILFLLPRDADINWRSLFSLKNNFKRNH